MKASLRALWCVCVLAVAGLGLSSAQQDVNYIPLDGDLVLFPESASIDSGITGILWKFGTGKVAEWDDGFGPEIDYYGEFKSRTALDKGTGQLVINNMRIEDSGTYSVEVNGLVQHRTYEVKVIKKVPKPSVAIKPPLDCSLHSTSCVLVCSGDITESGPVTYCWRKDEGKWVASGLTPEQLDIVNDEEGKKVKQFFCEMRNSFSVEHSDPFINPFGHEGPTPPAPPTSPVWIIVGVSVSLCLAVILVVGWISRNRIKTLLSKPGPEMSTEDFTVKIGED